MQSARQAGSADPPAAGHMTIVWRVWRAGKQRAAQREGLCPQEHHPGPGAAGERKRKRKGCGAGPSLPAPGQLPWHLKRERCLTQCASCTRALSQNASQLALPMHRNPVCRWTSLVQRARGAAAVACRAVLFTVVSHHQVHLMMVCTRLHEAVIRHDKIHFLLLCCCLAGLRPRS